jgi:hypothetical protein
MAAFAEYQKSMLQKHETRQELHSDLATKPHAGLEQEAQLESKNMAEQL